jgi:hypothetical protein
MAGPVLEESHMKTPSMNDILGEPLVDARTVAHAYDLPLYILIQPAERARRGIPYYRVGKLVRFKLKEMEAWLLKQGSGHKDA